MKHFVVYNQFDKTVTERYHCVLQISSLWYIVISSGVSDQVFSRIGSIIQGAQIKIPVKSKRHTKCLSQTYVSTSDLCRNTENPC